MTNQELRLKWDEVLKNIKEEITPVAYSTWIENLVPKRVDEQSKVFYITANTNIVFNIISKRYKEIIEKAVSSVFNENYSISVSEEQKNEPTLNGNQENSIFTDEKYLNPKYSFENFVVGPNNQMAHAAALAVAQFPSDSYNPLFLYGDSGLGKTHLMHAIGHYILKNSNKKVLYVTTEMFTNELITAMRSNSLNNVQKMNEFRSKYRDIDILLIDDIQFLEGKTQTQEEFFNTFEYLFRLKKQIVISSDKAPTKLTKIEERLRSRFSWNLVADISAPDLETRVAILLNNANNEGIEVNKDVEEVINFIAEKYTSNIRDLEGAFTRVISFSDLLHENINMPFAKKVLKEIINNKDEEINPVNIKKKVCKYFNIKIADIESSKRVRTLAYPRQIAMYLCRELTSKSLPEIGENFGGRDHTTVLHACKKITEELKSNDELKKIISDLQNDIQL